MVNTQPGLAVGAGDHHRDRERTRRARDRHRDRRSGLGAIRTFTEVKASSLATGDGATALT